MKDDRVFLAHSRDAIARIESYTAGGREAFFDDTKTQDAVIRNLEVIGEAVKNLSADLRAQHPEMPWTRIAGMRDVLIHDYFGVRLETVWNVVRPELKSDHEAVRRIHTEAFSGSTEATLVQRLRGGEVRYAPPFSEA